MSKGHPQNVLILGAGPAGLTAARSIQRHDTSVDITVFEAGAQVGGIARTETHRGFRFDIGGHRFFTKVPRVERVWIETLGDDFIRVPRLSRIYYRRQFFDYPLKAFRALRMLGLIEAVRIVLSYVYARLRPRQPEISFEDWVVNRFGLRLYRHFFESYTEKVWGIRPTEIRADWAAQRIKGLSLISVAWAALTGRSTAKSLIEEFDYPRLGPGMVWEALADELSAHGAEVAMQTKVQRLGHENGRITFVETVDHQGTIARHDGPDAVLSSLALRDLIRMMEPPPPPHVVAAAEQLTYRDFLIVTLILDHADPFPDNWIYVHDPDVRVGRIQNFRAWSKDMVPVPGQSAIGMEYFCNIGDSLWAASDADLRGLAAHELQSLGLAPAQSVVDYKVIRQPKAYPVYDNAYQDAVQTLRSWLSGLQNFQTAGRNGLHRYNNQDHSMLSAMLAAENLFGASHDVWNVNVERAYHEEFQVDRNTRLADG